jgi:hypothetical protein
VIKITVFVSEYLNVHTHVSSWSTSSKRTVFTRKTDTERRKVSDTPSGISKVRSLQKGRTDFRIKLKSIQLDSYFFKCELNSPAANVEVSTSKKKEFTSIQFNSCLLTCANITAQWTITKLAWVRRKKQQNTYKQNTK